MKMHFAVGAMVIALSLIVMGCDPPPTCDTSLKHLTTVSNYPTNIYKQAIGSSPALASNSAAIISRQAANVTVPNCKVTIGGWSSAIYYVDASQQRNTYVTLHLDGNPSYRGLTGAGPIRWRSCIAGGSESDGNAMMIDEADGCQYEFWMLNKNGLIADPEAGNACALPTNDADAIWGMDDGSSGSLAGNISMYSGMVWPNECTSGFDHGFFFATRWCVNNPSAVVYPIVHTDGSGTSSDDLFQGMRVQLNPGYDISGLATYQQAIAQALKTYGMIDANSNDGTWNMKGPMNQGYTNNPWTGVLPDPTITSIDVGVPVSQFRVIAPVWGTFRSVITDNDCITYQYQTGVNTPTITSLSPSSGTIAGGTTVTLTGTKFVNGVPIDRVHFGGVEGSNLNVISDTQATCTAPAYAQAGEIHVVVEKNNNGTSNRIHYTYTAGGSAPTISSLSPNNGTTAGGTSVTLNGTNLTGTTAISFGGTAGTSIVNMSSTQVRCTSPAHSAGSVSVTATTANGTSNGATYTYNAPAGPTLSAIAPTSGTTAGGTACTLTGTNLTGCSAVSFGGTAATGIVVDSSTQVRCTSPAKSAGTISVTATTSNGTSNGVNYTYTGGGTTATLYATADARVVTSSANTNFGTAITTYVQKNASTENASYFKWDLNGISGTSITSAKLRLYRNAGTATTNKVYSCATDTWIESGTGGITWNNKPAYGTQQASFSVAAAAGYNEVDVTSYVNANFNGDKLVTMIICDDQNLNIQCAYQTDEGTNRPQLVVISQ